MDEKEPELSLEELNRQLKISLIAIQLQPQLIDFLKLKLDYLEFQDALKVMEYLFETGLKTVKELIK